MARILPPLFAVVIFAAVSGLAGGGAGAGSGVGAGGDDRHVWLVGLEIDGGPGGLPVDSGVIPKIPAQYDTGVVRRVVSALSKFYSENGYPYNGIAASIIREDRDPSIISLRLRVDAGERVCGGPAVIVGVSGRGGIYMNDARIVPGRLYSSADVDEAARRLSARPYVRAVSALSPVIIEDAEPCVVGAGETLTLRTAVTPIAIAENRGMAIEGALGYRSGRGGDNGAVNGRVDLSFVNMLRHGETVDVSYVGASAAQRLKLSGSKPWAFGLPLEVGGGVGLEVEDGGGGYGFFGGDVWSAAEVNARYRVGVSVKASEVVPSASGDTGVDNGFNESGREPYTFYGADVFVSLIESPWESGRTVWEFEARTGSGVANREKSYNRSGAELAAGVHHPVINGRFAAAARLRVMAMFTDEEYLPAVEMYRVGGHGSLRGYSEDEFAFRSAAYSQIEALYYFNRYGSVYIFMDGGAGFDSRRVSLSSARKMAGYGAGVRFPSRLGVVSVEWARNIGDGWELGRVHIGVKRYM